MDPAVSTSHAAPDRQHGIAARRPAAWQLVAGALSAVIGLAPWLATGARLPLQNLWATDTLPDDMPLALLPFSQYHLGDILALLVVGGALAGVAVRLVPASRRRHATIWSLAGLATVQLVAIVQTAVVVRGGLVADGRAGMYFGAMLAVAVLGLLLGLGTLVACGWTARPGTTVAAAIGALALATWLSMSIAATDDASTVLGPPVSGVWRWLPAVLVGAVLAWCGLSSGRHVTAWIVSLALLWAVPAVLLAVTYAAGSRVLLGNPAEAVRAALDVLPPALGVGGPSLVTVPVAVAIGVGGLAWRAWRSIRHDRHPVGFDTLRAHSVEGATASGDSVHEPTASERADGGTY